MDSCRCRRLSATFSKTLKLCLLVFVLVELNHPSHSYFFQYNASALMVTPPLSSSDYRQLATLLVQTFDAPQAAQDSSENSIASRLEWIQWNLVEKSLSEQFTYNQYISTARKMRGKKYALFVAKEYMPPQKDNDYRACYEVVGLAEMGMTVGPIRDEIEGKETLLRPRATVGVLCVKDSYRNQGIGKVLLEKCENTSRHVWNETRLFVEVEPSNVDALTFFRGSQYNSITSASVDDKMGSHVIMRNATVVRRRKMESRPHIVLEKSLIEFYSQ